jgi:hypothetical protein
MTVNPNNSSLIYCTNNVVGTIVTINFSGQVTNTIATNLIYPQSITFDNNNVLYCSTNNSIVKIQNNTQSTFCEIFIGTGLVFVNDYLYACQYDIGNMLKIDLEANKTTFVSGLTFPQNLAYCNYNGNLYCSVQNAIYEINMLGEKTQIISQDNSTFTGLTFNSTNKLFIGNFSNNIIYKTVTGFCLASGTMILSFSSTSQNDVETKIDELKEGDLIKTYKHGYRKIKKIIKSTVYNSDNENRLGLALGKFLTNPEQQLQAIIQTESFIPTNRRVQIEGNLLPIESVLLQQSHNAVAVPLDDWEKLNKILEEGEFWYERAIAGEISSSKAAHQLTLYIQSDLDQEVKKIN